MLEKGYSQLPNVVLFDTALSPNAKLLYCLISSLCASRGYCFASNQYLAEKLGLSVGRVSHLITSLEKYLDIRNGQNEKRQICLAKNSKGGSQKQQGSIAKNSKHNNTSINKQVEYKPKAKALVKIEGEPLIIAERMAVEVTERYQFIKAQPEKWAADIEKLHRIDGHDYQTILAVMNWSQNDDFWKQNIRSGAKLRKHFDDLLVRATSQKQRVMVIS